MSTNFYLQRYGYGQDLVARKPHPDLNLVVVIPCYNEPELIRTLEALYHCTLTRKPVAVIVVINQSEDDDGVISTQNQKSYQEALQWTTANSTREKQFHILFQDQLPAKHAGVGLARKIGMDQAVWQFEKVGNHRGIIACFDADCICDTNYLAAIENHFNHHTSATGASIYFEHPLSGPLDAKVYQGILYYELFLRYYRHALRYAGYPYAYYSIGSCLAIRSESYQKQGGMNRRKAGEDFYFIEEHCRMGNLSEITTTRVIPSPRVSNRVPFGTGARQSDWMASSRSDYPTFNPQSFKDLRTYLKPVEDYFSWSPAAIEQRLGVLSQPLKQCLSRMDVMSNLMEIKRETTNPETFRKRFFHWFNGLRILQFLHREGSNAYQDVPLAQAANWLISEVKTTTNELSAGDLLKYYRQLDREG